MESLESTENSSYFWNYWIFLRFCTIKIKMYFESLILFISRQWNLIRGLKCNSYQIYQILIIDPEIISCFEYRAFLSLLSFKATFAVLNQNLVKNNHSSFLKLVDTKLNVSPLKMTGLWWFIFAQFSFHFVQIRFTNSSDTTLNNWKNHYQMRKLCVLILFLKCS